MFCRECGSGVGAADRFCGSCGAAQARGTAPAAVAGGPVLSPPAPPHGYAQLPSYQQRSYRASPGVAMASQVVFWVWSGSAGLAGLLAFPVATTLADYIDAPSTSDADEWADFIAARDSFDALLLLSYLVGIAALVLFIIFLFQTNKAQDRFAPSRIWSRGWTIGCWFIPLANLVLPALVVNDVDQIASEHDPRGDGSGGWWPGLAFWWGLYVVGIVLLVLGSGMTEGSDPDAAQSGYALEGAAGLAMCGAGIVAGFLVRRIASADQAAP